MVGKNDHCYRAPRDRTARANVCRGCGLAFSSLEIFDRHRIGRHAYSYADGLNLDPALEDGRRCLDENEMLARGWVRDGRGRWTDPARSGRAAERLAKPCVGLGVRAGALASAEEGIESATVSESDG
jgi:hypothetical protein